MKTETPFILLLHQGDTLGVTQLIPSQVLGTQLDILSLCLPFTQCL